MLPPLYLQNYIAPAMCAQTEWMNERILMVAHKEHKKNLGKKEIWKSIILPIMIWTLLVKTEVWSMFFRTDLAWSWGSSTDPSHTMDTGVTLCHDDPLLCLASATQLCAFHQDYDRHPKVYSIQPPNATSTIRVTSHQANKPQSPSSYIPSFIALGPTTLLKMLYVYLILKASSNSWHQ